MTRIIPLLLLAISFSTSLSAQEAINWKKHKKLADNLFEATQYIDAAAHYEAAWQQHPKDKDLIYKAGKCYYTVKNFKKAIQAFQHVQTENNRYPLVGLRYARALKQDGQYEAANDAFLYFINAYQGGDKDVMANVVATEIKGCDLGLKMRANPTKGNLRVKHLSENINSPVIEFAPIPYTDDLLYYSSTMKDNQAYLYRSQRKNGVWNKSVIAKGLPAFPEKHFANGSFAPDAKRFYFTLCDNGDGLSSKCEIYVLKRTKSKWSEPIRLHDYINIQDATTTTQPWVVHQNGQEILYFASDRPGGLGGLDIWYSTRQIGSDDIDFTYPVNLGNKVNTLGDEMTPFYDLHEKALYFSSNGQISIGGWDIFKTKGQLDQWSMVENLGSPINSSADEFYYVLKPSRKGGFFASNRLYGVEKISTQDEDIFEFSTVQKTSNLYAIGQVMDSETMTPLDKVRISLFDVSNSQPKLLSSKIIAQSNYRFQILPNKKLRLVAEKKGYLKNTYDFDSFNAHPSIDYTHIFSLSAQSATTPLATAPREKNENSIPNYTASTNGVDESVISTTPSNNSIRTNNHRTQASASVSIAAPSTTEFKVQVVAVNYHDINHARYNNIRNIGKFETERLENVGVTRVLITDLPNKQAAEKIRKQVIGHGFLDAFIVKYKDGKRMGRSW